LPLEETALSFADFITTRLQLFTLLDIRLIAYHLTAMLLFKSAAGNPGRTTALLGRISVFIIPLGIIVLNVGNSCLFSHVDKGQLQTGHMVTYFSFFNSL